MSEGAKWQLVAAAAAAVLAVFGAVRLLDSPEPESEPVDVIGSAGRLPSGRRDGAAGRREGALLVVHVAGAVRRPGVYRLTQGARAGSAVARAGGATGRADLTAVNLAAPVVDGQQVIVPLRMAAGGAAAGGASGAEAPLSLATAGADQLEELDGIGETLAERIVEYRDAQGGVRSIDELAEVDGIGEKRLAALKEELRP